MTNIQYIEKILSSVERILVDTSTLMTPGFQQFICNNKERLSNAKQKIVVSKAVHGELARLTASTDMEKSKLATAAIELLVLNKSIFQIENAPLTEEEIAHAFADAQLLAELTLHRSKYNQLLITNDRKLSCDAYDLNQQQSCKGRKVLVCYINWCGELQRCDCARPTTESAGSEPTVTTSKRNIRNTTNVPRKEIDKNTWKFDWFSGLLSISGAVLIYGICKGSKAFFRSVT